MDRFHEILKDISDFAQKAYQKQKSNSDISNPMMNSIEPMNEMQDEYEDSSTVENTEYKQELYEMSLSSLKAIKAHVLGILNAIEENKPNVKENLTEPWLQGKIAIIEDYLRNIHDFVMFSEESDDSTVSGSRPGLWENIRKKKEREGKKYKPAKPGDKDRPDPQAWKNLTKKE
jgi:hypothetical protein